MDASECDLPVKNYSLSYDNLDQDRLNLIVYRIRFV